MRTCDSRFRTAIALLAGFVLAGLTGLAMAASDAALGGDLLGRWLVGWLSAALVLVPATVVLARLRPSSPAERPARASHPFRTHRLG
jgi:hypothetical protein